MITLIDRSLEIEEESYNEAKKYTLELEKEFETARKDIETDIELFYLLFAKNNKITLAEAKINLNNDERRKFQKKIEYYIERSSATFRSELNSLSKRIRIARKEVLLTSINFNIDKLFQSYKASVKGLLSTSYNDSYLKHLHMIQKDVGFGVQFSALTDKDLNNEWSGKSYTDRIDEQKAQAISNAKGNIIQGFARNETATQQNKRVENVLGVSKRNAKTLVMTENSFYLNEASKLSYIEMGITEYEYLATLDNRTSDICISLDGEIFKVDKAIAGINYPPMHYNCRSTTVPVISDSFIEKGLRSARNNEGNVYLVPSNISYTEWKQKYS